MGLPHGKTSNVLRPSICFGRLLNPVIWNEKTGEKVKYVILIAVPEKKFIWYTYENYFFFSP